MLRKIEGKERNGMTKDEIVGWYHRLNGHEFAQTPGDGDREAWRAHNLVTEQQQ